MVSDFMEWNEISFLQKHWIKYSALILANLMTLTSLVLGIVGIVLTFKSYENYSIYFAKILAVCSIFDFADGKLARIGGSKKIAVDVDTISDSIVFGILPAIYLGYWVSDWSIVAGVFTGLIYAGAVWFRLYRFVKKDPMYTPYFRGLPSPFAAMVIACLLIFPDTPEWGVLIATIILAGFMISTIPFASFKGVPSKFDWFWIVITTLVFILFAVFPTELMIFPAYNLAALMIFYLVAGPIYAEKLDKKYQQDKKINEKKVVSRSRKH